MSDVREKCAKRVKAMKAVTVEWEMLVGDLADIKTSLALKEGQIADVKDRWDALASELKELIAVLCSDNPTASEPS